MKNYEKWLAPGTQVFSGDPDYGASSGIIPPCTEVKVQTITGWPTRRGDIYVPVKVIKIRALATDSRRRIGDEISVGGFTIYPGCQIHVHRIIFTGR